MKNYIKLFSVLIVFLLTSSFTINTDPDNTIQKNEKIEIIFNRTLKFEDLYQIKLNLNEKGITLDFRKLEFDEKGGLCSIDFKVDCNDGYSGSANEKNLTNKSKFGFYRDYSKTATTPFGTGKLH